MPRCANFAAAGGAACSGAGDGDHQREHCQSCLGIHFPKTSTIHEHCHGLKTEAEVGSFAADDELDVAAAAAVACRDDDVVDGGELRQ